MQSNAWVNEGYSDNHLTAHTTATSAAAPSLAVTDQDIEEAITPFKSVAALVRSQSHRQHTGGSEADTALLIAVVPLSSRCASDQHCSQVASPVQPCKASSIGRADTTRSCSSCSVARCHGQQHHQLVQSQGKEHSSRRDLTCQTFVKRSTSQRQPVDHVVAASVSWTRQGSCSCSTSISTSSNSNNITSMAAV